METAYSYLQRNTSDFTKTLRFTSMRLMLEDYSKQQIMDFHKWRQQQPNQMSLVSIEDQYDLFYNEQTMSPQP